MIEPDDPELAQAHRVRPLCVEDENPLIMPAFQSGGACSWESSRGFIHRQRVYGNWYPVNDWEFRSASIRQVQSLEPFIE